MIYKTESMYQAAAMLSQSEFLVEYIGLEDTAKAGRFCFLLEHNEDDAVVDEWVTKYTRQRTSVEPKTYDNNLGILRDDSKHAKKKGK